MCSKRACAHPVCSAITRTTENSFTPAASGRAFTCLTTRNACCRLFRGDRAADAARIRVAARLPVNRRNTQRIVRTIDSVTGMTGARVSERAPEGDSVVTTCFTGKADLVAKVHERLAELRTAGFSAADIVVLGPRRLENSGLSGSRREAVVADRGLGRFKWAESAPCGVA
jgi:hypothetical protein